VILTGAAERDIVMDAFAGSGTTIAAAEKLGMRWIGIDSGKLSVYTIQRRLANLKTAIGNKRGRSIRSKPFTLYNAGLYDFSRLKSLTWEDWRFTALSLFQCQDKPHKVGGITLDGYRSGDDVLVFNYRISGGAVLDYGFIDDLHSQIGPKIGARFFIIAPAASVTFLEDYVTKGSTRYYILRIPYSIINELHSKDFEPLSQPVDDAHVNETVDSVGFDFIRPPKVECDYIRRTNSSNGVEEAVIKIKTFKSEAMAKGASYKGNLETLSMVLIDYDYPYDASRKGKESPPPFEVDTRFYGSEVRQANGEIGLPFARVGEYMMLIYIDIYGNEYTEIKSNVDFENAANSRKAFRKSK
jgi:DNA methylase